MCQAHSCQPKHPSVVLRSVRADISRLQTETDENNTNMFSQLSDERTLHIGIASCFIFVTRYI